MKVLIVDDELPIREWIRMTMEKIGGSVEEVRAAGNGREAWSIFEELHPDLVITDIRMPKMDGLELLQRVRETAPGTYVIMLTSYDEFEYAREAMKYRANEYILKSEVTEDLLQQVIRNYQQHLREQQGAAAVQYLKAAVEPAGEGQPCPFEAKAGERYFVITFRQEQGTEQGFSATVNNFVHRVEYLFYEQDVPLWVCFYKNHYSTGACFAEMMSFCQNIASMRGTFVGLAEAGEDWRQTCRNARQALNASFYEQRQRVFVYRCENEESIGRIKSLRKKIIAMIGKARQQEARDYIEKLTRLAAQEKILDVELIKLCCQDIVDAYKVTWLEFAGHELDELCRESKKQMLEADTFAGLQQRLDDFMAALQETAALGQKPYSGYVKSAIAYIMDNYAGLESLTEVAGYVNINADYLSRIFKAETGVTFNAFLTNYRIKKAIQLLTQTDLKVYEVAERVGYPNLSYFSKVFKKVTGVNPFFYKN